MAKKQSSDDATPPSTRGDRNAGEPAEIVRYWLNEIGAARKREKFFRKNGVRIRELYENSRAVDDSPDAIGGPRQPFAILYSNTETLMPALYSAMPRPVVQRRFKDEDPLGRHAAQAGQRLLEFLLDTNIDGYDDFGSTMRAATLDGLLVGRGVTSVKYDAEVQDTEPAEGETEGTPVKQSELVCLNIRSWDRVLFGYARKWSNVPWVAYEEHIDKEEATRLFGKKIADKINFTKGEENDDEDGKYQSSEDEHNLGERKTALVYQIWDKEGGRKLLYVSPHYIDGLLKVGDDPLELTGFFDCPRPLGFIEKTNSLLPVALYTLYENQAEELNRLTSRIQRVIGAIKARGLYAGEHSEEFDKLFSEDDNALVPAGNQSSLAFEKGLTNAIWFLPLDVLIQVLQQLYVARESCKQVIYEITGISDIIRGATKASETLGAQQLKSQWGTLRIKPKQEEVQRYVRDLLRMMLEIAASKFSEETWSKMTGLPFLLSAKFNELKAVAQALQVQVQMETQKQTQQAQMMAQQTGQPPAPPQPGPAAQQLQQVMQQLQTPQWSQVLAMLRDDMQRAYRIDIETNSTIQPEAAEDAQNITELLTAMGQYLNGIAPLVQSGSMPFGAAKSMLLAISRRFRFGSEVEDEINAMQAPKPPDDGSAKLAAVQQQAQAAMQQEQQKGAQLQMKGAQEKAASDAQVSQLDTQLKAAKLENAAIKREADLALRELKLKSEEAIFELEKKRVTETMDIKVAAAGDKIESRRHLAGMEKAHASKEIGTKQDAAEAAGTKLDSVVAELKDAQKELLTTIDEAATKSQELIKALTAPRKRTAVRDKEGRIESTIEEPMKELLTTIDNAVSNNKELIKALTAPRKRTAIRDKEGRIESTIEEST